MVLRAFALGMIITLPAAFIELLFTFILDRLHLDPFAHGFISIFVVVAFVEEFLKYLIIRWVVMKTIYFDEPIDAMIYPIIVALGFAALENILAIFKMSDSYLTLIIWRFVSATLIHALSASVWGYFIALVYFLKKPRYFLIIGLILGTLIHGLYNLIVSSNDQIVFTSLFPLLILPISFIVAMEFKRLHIFHNS